MTDAAGVALATQGLAKRYGPRVALDGLDLRVPTGVVYGFLGPNGAGKTTTMRILTGLIRPDAGNVELLGRPFGRGDRKRLFEVGALIESPSFYPFLSGRENLRALAATGAPTPRPGSTSCSTLVNLRDRASDRVSGYSLGMKQRLGIAGALLSRPEAAAARRAGERPRPGGHRRDARHAAGARGDRQDRVRLVATSCPRSSSWPTSSGSSPAGRLVREGPIDDAAARGGLRADPGARSTRSPTAGPTLEQVAGAGQVSLEHGPEGGWLDVRIDPDRAGELNRALAGRRGVRVADRGRDEPRGAVPRAHRVDAGPRERGAAGTPGGRPRAARIAAGCPLDAGGIGMRLLRSNLASFAGARRAGSRSGCVIGLLVLIILLVTVAGRSSGDPEAASPGRCS